MIVLLHLAYINIGLAIIYHNAGDIITSNMYVLSAINSLFTARMLFGHF